MLLSFLYVYVVLLLGICGGQSSSKYCSVCRVLINEAEWIISQVDPKKSIQVGSFRVDPKGNQKIKDKQYARSEVHIEEIIESVCDKLGYYGQITFENGTTQMVRTTGFNGQRLETKGLNLDKDKGSAFKYKCENFLEDHEEEIIPLLQRGNIPDYGKLICGEHLAVCSLDELAVPILTLPEAVDDFTVGEVMEEAGDNEEAVDENNSQSDAGEDSAESESVDSFDSPSENVEDKTEL